MALGLLKGDSVPVQQGQSKHGPALAHLGTAYYTVEVLLFLQVLTDEPPDFLWDIFKSHGGTPRALCTDVLVLQRVGKTQCSTIERNLSLGRVKGVSDL